MIDFTLKSYAEYVIMIKNHFEQILTFEEYFSWNKDLHKFCVIRHDVDRKLENALNMASLEHTLGIRSTYFFRTKKRVFDKKIIRKIARMGHEIGYHYESLADAKGNYNLALQDFSNNLNKLKKIVRVSTVCMHGKPFSPYDSRDLWRKDDNHDLLRNVFNIHGEVYLDINYNDITYISDTGRNWQSDRFNVRDKVNSSVNLNLTCKEDLVRYLKNPHNNLVFLVHPERWNEGFCEYSFQFLKDQLINAAKKFL